MPVAVCEPAHGYPFRWYVAPWLEGENPKPDRVDLCQLARELATFVVALQEIETTAAPPPGPGQRGGPLLAADEQTRTRADRLRGEVDVDGLLAVWQRDWTLLRSSTAPSGSTATCPTATSSCEMEGSPARSIGAV